MASFHAVYLPAMLIALGQPLPIQLLSHAHWTVERAKMSKSVGNVADPIKAIDDVGVDLVRYYLARVGGRFQDDVGRFFQLLPLLFFLKFISRTVLMRPTWVAADWSQSQLLKHSREIVSLLGNLFMRATSDKIMKKVADVKPRNPLLVSESSASKPLLDALKVLAPKFDDNLRKFELADAVEAVVAALSEVRFPTPFPSF